MVAGYRIDRKPPKTYKTIRACASIIMNAMQTGETLDVSKYNSATITAAYKLLMFEQIITRQSGYTLTETGKRHIAKHGFNVYNPMSNEEAK